MSETLNSNLSNDPFNVLQKEPTYEEHMEKITKEDNQNTIVSAGEVSKLFRNQDGNIGIESKYLDMYYDYEKSDVYDYKDKEDRRLGHAIWDLGMSAALLDATDFKKFDSSNDQAYVDLESLDSDSLQQYKKAWNSLLAMINDFDENQISNTIEKFRRAGKVGEYFAGLYETMVDAKEIGHPFHSFQLESVNETSQIDVLEEEFNKATNFSGANSKLDKEKIDELYARYGDVLKTISDPTLIEKIKNRREKLSKLSVTSEKINKMLS